MSGRQFQQHQFWQIVTPSGGQPGYKCHGASEIVALNFEMCIFAFLCPDKLKNRRPYLSRKGSAYGFGRTEETNNGLNASKSTQENFKKSGARSPKLRFFLTPPPPRGLRRTPKSLRDFGVRLQPQKTKNAVNQQIGPARMLPKIPLKDF